MATGLGFCPSCGTPRVAAEQQFCPICGAALAAISAPAPIAPPPAPPVEAAVPPWAASTPPAAPADFAAAPPPWAAPAAVTPPPAPAADFAAAPPPWAAPAAAAPPPAPPTDYAPPPPPAWGAPAGQGYQPVPPQYAAAPVGPAQNKKSTSPALLLVVLLLIAGIAAGGFYVMNNNKSGPGSSGNPAGNPTGNPTGPVASGQLGGNTSNPPATPAGNGGDLSSAASNFASIKSYKFSMTLAGGSFGSMLSGLPGVSGSSDAPFTMSGMVTTDPAAADIMMAGFHIIEVGGFDYLDMSGTGTFYKTPASGTSMAESLSPATMFSSAMDTSGGSGFSKVGTDTKNGVKADHYTASASALAAYGSSLGVAADATWSADVWIAQDGGYPVSMSILAVGSDKSVLYQITFDISNINDPSNNITAPANAIGA
jgi:hypothetical protein